MLGRPPLRVDDVDDGALAEELNPCLTVIQVEQLGVVKVIEGYLRDTLHGVADFFTNDHPREVDVAVLDLDTVLVFFSLCFIRRRDWVELLDGRQDVVLLVHEVDEVANLEECKVAITEHREVSVLEVAFHVAVSCVDQASLTATH